MSKLIIICGLPGSGKTTLSNNLSKKLKIFCLHKDSVKESIYDSMKMSTLEDSIKLGYPSVKAIMDLAEENLQRGVDVILESPFDYEAESRIFEEWKKRYSIDIYTIVLEISEKERTERFKKRERARSHHDRERKYDKVKCDYMFMPEKIMFLRSDSSVNKLTDKIIDFIKINGD